MENPTAEYKLCLQCGTEFKTAEAACPACGMDQNAGSGGSLVGKTVSEYEVLELIGRGGWSEVYRARHQNLDTDRALKVLHQHLALDHVKAERFHREAQAASALNHPNIVRVFDFGSLPEGRPYIVMDLLRGLTLRDILKIERRLQPERVLQLFLQSARALAEAHKHQIIHRDITPNNLMVINPGNEQESIKILDFGLAKSEQFQKSLALTETGAALGSPAYMSPEQCLGRNVGPSSDVYSLGCVFYEMLTGVQPFPAKNANEALLRQLSPELPESFGTIFGSAVDDKSAELEAVVFKALEKNLARRYATADDLVKALLDVRNRTFRSRMHAWHRRLLHDCRRVHRTFFRFDFKRNAFVLSGLIIALCVGLLVKRASAPKPLDPAPWLTLLKNGTVYEKRGNPTQAEAYYRTAERVALSSNAPAADQAKIARDFGTFLASIGKLAAASDEFGKAINLYRATGMVSDEYCLTYEQIVGSLMTLQRTSAAYGYAVDGYNAMRSHFGERNEHTINMLGTLGALTGLFKGQERKGLEMQLQSYDMRMKYSPQCDDGLVALSLNISALAYKAGEYAVADKFGKLSIECANKHDGKTSLRSFIAVRQYIDTLVAEHKNSQLQYWIKIAAQIEALHPGQAPVKLDQSLRDNPMRGEPGKQPDPDVQVHNSK